MDKIYKQCQSCAIPLVMKDKDNRGTEKEGTKSNMYCFRCYKNGEFIDPALTLEEMKKIIDKVPELNFFMKFLTKMQLPSLERWKK